MKKTFYTLMLLSALILSGCSNNESTPEQVKLQGNTPTEIVINEDGTNNGSNINFVAAAPWTATITDATGVRAGGSEVEWLELNQYSGEAGEYSLKLTIWDNTTSQTRKAVITIVCGETTITITVEQKPTTGDSEGEDSEANKGLLKTFHYQSSTAQPGGIYDDSFTVFYTYEGGKLVKLVNQIEIDKNRAETMEFTYPNSNEIYVNINGTDLTSESSEENPEYETYNYKYIIKLNEDGNAVELWAEENDSNNGKISTMEYDSEGRLVQVQSFYKNKLENTETFSYENGVLKKYNCTGMDNIACTMDDNAYTHEYANTMQINISGIIAPYWDNHTFLYFIGLMGKSSDLMPESYKVTGDEDITVKQEFEFDNEKRVSKLKSDRSTEEQPRIYEFTYNQ